MLLYLKKNLYLLSSHCNPKCLCLILSSAVPTSSPTRNSPTTHPAFPIESPAGENGDDNKSHVAAPSNETAKPLPVLPHIGFDIFGWGTSINHITYFSLLNFMLLLLHYSFSSFDSPLIPKVQWTFSSYISTSTIYYPFVP